MSSEERARLIKQARDQRKREMLRQNVNGFLKVLQNPDNSEEDRKTAASFLDDLVEKLRKRRYKKEFRTLESKV